MKPTDRTTRRLEQAFATLLLAASSLQAQVSAPPTAPLPAALTIAHKLFLGNAGDQENADCLRAYNDLYADVTALNHFQLVPDPAASDLVLELHYEVALGQALGSNDRDIRQFRLVLLDPHTHTVLWSLTERTNYAVRQRNRNSNLDETVSKLVADFSSLTSAQPPNNNSRVPHGFPSH